MQPRMTKDILLNALLMAVWRRNPQKQVLIHSDQGRQYTSHKWQSFLKSHGLEGSMSRRGHCHLLNTRSNIINDPEVSELSVAIHPY